MKPVQLSKLIKVDISLSDQVAHLQSSTNNNVPEYVKLGQEILFLGLSPALGVDKDYELIRKLKATYRVFLPNAEKASAIALKIKTLYHA